MKRAIILAVVCVGLLTGCGESAPSSANSSVYTGANDALNADGTAVNANHQESDVPLSSGDVIVIREKMFIAQTNDVYFNTEDYLGKTIQYEGIFDIYEAPESADKYYSVIRYGPGCCGVDANAGFEVKWDGEYPRQDDWVEVTGVLEEYEEEGYKYLRLALTSLDVLTERGAEYVSQ